jgi:hypothetical protein
MLACHKHILKSIHADYIYHKNGKSKPCENGFALLENDITKILDP